MVINSNCSPWVLLVGALVGGVCQLVDIIYPNIIEIQVIKTLPCLCLEYAIENHTQSLS